MSSTNKAYLLLKNLIPLILSSVVTILGGVTLLGMLYSEFIGTHPFIIATSPADATIKINGTSSGKSPLNINLKIGTYTVEAEKQGYETTQHAIFVSGGQALDFVNIQLIPLPNQQIAPIPRDSHVVINTQTDKSLRKDVEKLKAALIADPDEAISLPIIREKLRVQEELSKSLREELKEIKEQNKWYLGLMSTFVVGLIGVIATLFTGQSKKLDA